MAIRVSTPGGATIEFPDGTDEGTIQRVMAQASGGQPDGDVGRFAQPKLTQPKDPVSAGEMIADVGKSAGIGLAQGAIGLATLPGNIEALGRAGINFGAGLVGVEPPVDSDTFLTNYNDAKKRIEGFTGEFYQPQTTAGKYTRTVGEFAGGMGAAGAASKVVRGLSGAARAAPPLTTGQKAAAVVVPGVASETAGQLTEGTALEPWARVAAAVAATRAPNVAARTITPAPADPVRAQAVRTLEQNGVNAITAGQRTGNERVRWIEDATAMVPGGGGRATAMQNQAADQFTVAALRRAGIQAERATPDVMDQAFRAIGNEYDNLGRNIQNVRTSPGFIQSMQGAVREYERRTPQASQIPLVQEMAGEIMQRAAQGGLPGDVFMGFRSNLARERRALKNNPDAANAVGRMIEALDAQMVRGMPRGQQQQTAAYLRNLNERYRNMLTIEDAASRAGEAATAGVITPANLRMAVKGQSKRSYATGRHPMADLARAGAQVITPLRSSGTAERSFAQGVVGAPSSVGSAIAGGVASGGDPVITALSALGPWAAKAATARGIMSGPAQNYFANQRIPSQIPPQDMNRLLSMFPFMATRDD